MKRVVLVCAALPMLLWSAAAMALSVSNLDEVEHRVVFEAVQGSKITRVVKPGETVQILQSGGEVYLANKPKRRMHVYANDVLAIWKEGNLQIQMRRKVGGDAF